MRFTEPVRVLGAPSFGLTLGSAEVSARYVPGSGSDTLRFEYTVQRGDYDADGVSVELVDGESPFILDGAAIRAVADDEAVDLIADGSATIPAGAQHKVDGRVAQAAVAASISSSPESGSTYGAGETITVRLAMNDDVLVTGRPHVLLNVGAARRQAVYIGPIGTATDCWEFSYVVQAGDFDADGVALCARGAAAGRSSSTAARSGRLPMNWLQCCAIRRWRRRRGTRWMRPSHCPCRRRRARRRSRCRPTGR